MIGEGSIPSDGVSLGSVVGARDGLRVGTVMKETKLSRGFLSTLHTQNTY